MSQKQCLITKRKSFNVTTKRLENKRIYEAKLKDGGAITLIFKTPISKQSQKIRDIFFRVVNENK